MDVAQSLRGKTHAQEPNKVPSIIPHYSTNPLFLILPSPLDPEQKKNHNTCEKNYIEKILKHLLLYMQNCNFILEEAA